MLRRMAHLPGSVLTRANRQFGIVTHAELLELGIGRGQIAYWLRRGYLEQIHWGVYRITGTSLVPGQDHYAAVRRGGRTARAGGPSALAYLGVEGFAFDDEPFVVIAEGSTLANVSFTWLAAPVPNGDAATLPGGVPGVTPTRGLVETAGVVAEKRTRVAYDDLRRRRLVSRPRVIEVAHRLLGIVPGAGTTLEIAAGGDLDKESEGERNLSTVLLPTDPWPLWQAWVLGDIRLDALYPEARLAPEYHGGRFHSIVEDRQHDRARAARLEREAQIKVLDFWKHDLADPTAVRERILHERTERIRAGIPPLRDFRLQQR